MVGDVNAAAEARYNELNLLYLPTVYVDAGDQVLVGGTTNENYYKGFIEISGTRPVYPLDLALKFDSIAEYTYKVQIRVGNGVDPLTVSPAPPGIPVGPSHSNRGVLNEFSVAPAVPFGDELYYEFDWGDGFYSGWYGPIYGIDTFVAKHSYYNEGSYDVRVRMKDSWGNEFDWTEPTHIDVNCCIDFRGNINGGGSIDIDDVVYLVDFAFGFPSGPEPPCILEADVDKTGLIDIDDVVYLVEYAFGFPSGPPPLGCEE